MPIQKARRRSFINRTALVGTISFFLIAAFLFSTWNTIASVTPHISHLKHTSSLHPQWHSSPLHLNMKILVQTMNDEQLRLQIDRLLTAKMKQKQFSGSVLIARDNRIILSKGYSMESWSRMRPNTPHTRFYLGSVTKEFTAMAILILQQRGKLHVRNSICAYIASCPRTWQHVTIHEILTHTSGIPGVDDASLSNASPQAWINSFNAFPMASSPGGQFSYCNVCYQILGYVVERVSGKSFSNFLQQAIFNPLHMKNTGFNPHYTSTPDHADGYDAWQDADSLAAWNLDPQWTFLFAAGLLYSTAEDIYRWDQALMHSTLVSQKTLDAAFTPYATSQYAGSKYGYGWFLTHGPIAGHRLIWHDGKIPGFRTYNGFYPQDGITLIVLSNLETLDEIALASEMQKIIFAHL
ncbi:MAG: beta-lactamase family protein [Ktedonobacteraceae bacterium]|nr:beta-lactamase family protein [Ktedonobacteraceae bacterium]